ncbi:MAG: hypothetical protein II877_07040 [Synergistaceae bacterium]|nr:hypothetical protein [Synergistaceae bacterium]
MSDVSQLKLDIIARVLDLSDELLPETMEYIMRQSIGYDEDEPPLTEDELREIAIAEQEIAEGKGIPLSELLKEFNQ